MYSEIDLKKLLRKIDHKGYPAYKETKGRYQFGSYIISIDHVQGDPFAAPSKVSVHISGEKAKFPKELYAERCQRIALQDEILRNFRKNVDKYTFQAKGSGKSGLISVSHCGQEILERTACQLDPKTGNLIVRMEIGFPANGRTINAKELEKIIFDFLPNCIENTLLYENVNQKRMREVADLAEDQEYIRKQLRKQNLVAFVANGSILPRESGISSKPMRGAIPFISPREMEITMELPHKGTLVGMGIPKGVTLIVGGGYHGKSTLLKALELGVYSHVQGDGREYVITDSSAMKIRAEDGRSIKKTDISMFISNLPNGKETCGFYTEDASGSTSQAANVVEGIEAGAKVLLIDEDTSATNFMVRDELMQRVIHREMEPITAFIDRVRELYENYDISTVIVAGSSGAYFHIADTILQMNRYEPEEITAYAKREAEHFPVSATQIESAKEPMFQRCPKKRKGFGEQDRIKMKVFGKEEIQINRESINLRYVEQLTDSEQANALGYCIRHMEQCVLDTKQEKTLQEIVNQLEEKMKRDGLGSLCNSQSSSVNLAMPRRQEIFAALNRYRGMEL